jgi:hypothetical protein
MSGVTGNSSSRTDHRKGCSEMPSFAEELPTLLRLMADPTTPHTSKELWCRIAADDWDRHAPTLLHELQVGENDVKRLVLSIICEQSSNVRTSPIATASCEWRRSKLFGLWFEMAEMRTQPRQLFWRYSTGSVAMMNCPLPERRCSH